MKTGNNENRKITMKTLKLKGVKEEIKLIQVSQCRRKTIKISAEEA